MKNFDTRTYNISDFVEWNSKEQLELSPRFQRKSVWTERAKSYLVDTVLRGKPIPKILITQSLRDGKNIRTVIDGQQRLRAILGYYAGDFAISRAHNPELAGFRYENLDIEAQAEFLKYEIGVDMLFDLSYEDTLDVFARLNTYSVKLNSQELLNAQYLGFFKQVAHGLGLRHVRYWIDGGVMTEKQVTRMTEAELASDLLGMLIDGIQSKKQIANYFKKYDEKEAEVRAAEEKFLMTMAYVGALYPPEQLKATNWSRVHFFNSLFCTVAHCLYGLPGADDIPRKNLTHDNLGPTRVKLDEITAQYDAVTVDGAQPDQGFIRFIETSRRATTDASTRKARVAYICAQL
ncbi:DUF262 domain-containing protein [Burkholderia gladioli]|uniref:GmrSD restriction endonuclease domain-containing protein n=1 Tax=Burkholderia gladioli TaxID=28095 RepID=UPI0016417B74|nr:DUF262 domain-containing protein [Burkholderia gladioli]